MEILRTIALYTEDKQMPFILIGGHAVNAYGIARQTGDIDILVQINQKPKWMIIFQKLRYKIGQNDERFARFSPETLGGWPIDLMFVDDRTFEKMYANSIEMLVGVATTKVVSARHLATLKIHALKYFQEHRYAKDMADLVSLLRSGKTCLTKTDLKELCERYANIELFEKIQGECP